MIRQGPGPVGVGGPLKVGPGRVAATPVHLAPLGRGGLTVRPNFPAIAINNRFYPFHNGPRFLWWRGARRAFIPLGLLGVAFFAGSYWYPSGYVEAAAPYCSGFTPEGCQLYWRDVDFEGGGSAPQCVQYCPQAGPPPANFVSLPPPPPPPPAGDCQLTIFADQNFAGLSAPTGDNQPSLAESGWQDAVSSIQIQGGTWDFFSADEFSGESIRLVAGSYPNLPPEWDKKINSFMCVQGSPSS